MNPPNPPPPRYTTEGTGLIFQWKLLVSTGTGLNSEILGSQDGDRDDSGFFFNLTQCGVAEIQQRFRRTSCLHLQGSDRKIDAAISTNILQISRLPIKG